MFMTDSVTNVCDQRAIVHSNAVSKWRLSTATFGTRCLASFGHTARCHASHVDALWGLSGTSAVTAALLLLPLLVRHPSCWCCCAVVPSGCLLAAAVLCSSGAGGYGKFKFLSKMGAASAGSAFQAGRQTAGSSAAHPGAPHGRSTGVGLMLLLHSDPLCHQR